MSNMLTMLQKKTTKMTKKTKKTRNKTDVAGGYPGYEVCGAHTFMIYGSYVYARAFSYVVFICRVETGYRESSFAYSPKVTFFFVFFVFLFLPQLCCILNNNIKQTKNTNS